MILAEATIIAVANAVQANAELGIRVIDSAPQDVKAELWKLWLADLKETRAFWRGVFGLGPN